jgi:hypothetical protein
VPPAPVGIAQWATTQTSNGVNFLFDSKTDPFGNVYMFIAYRTFLFINNYGSDSTDPITAPLYGTLGAGAGVTFCLVKYDSNGQALWATNITDMRDSYGGSIAFDSAGNVYLTAVLSSLNISLNNFVSGGGGGSIVTSLYGNLVSPTIAYYTLVVKYDQAGQIQWATKIETDGQFGASSITVSPTGSVYVIVDNNTGSYFNFYDQNGVFAGNVQTGAYGQMSVSAPNSSILVKYDSGGFVQWATKIDTQNGQLKEIKYAPNGSVYVSGICTTGSLDFYNWSSTAAGVVNTSLSGTISLATVNAYIAKISASGSLQWASTVDTGTIANSSFMGIAVDSDSNVYISGNYSALLTFNSFGSIGGGFTITTTPFGTLPVPAGSTDLFMVKYNPTGQVVWGTRVANASTVRGGSLVVDSDNNLFASGTYDTGITIDSAISASVTSPLGTMASVAPFSYFIVKYTSSGTAQWATNGGGSSSSMWSYPFISSTGNNTLYLSQIYDSTISPIYNYSSLTAGIIQTSYYNRVNPRVGRVDSMLVKYSTL